MFYRNKIAEEKEERISNALSIAWSYGQVDCDDYKAWVIDQMVRALCGSEEEYNEWVKKYEDPLNYGENLEWKTGIAPWLNLDTMYKRNDNGIY